MATRPARAAVTINGKVYFGLDSSRGEQDLWVTDGTSAGTRKLGNSSSFSGIKPNLLDGLWELGPIQWLDDPSNNTVLYRLDTATDIPQVLAAAQFNGNVENTIAVMDGYALFVSSGSQLWRTDGTGGGTVAITNFSMPGNGTPPLGSQDTVGHACWISCGFPGMGLAERPLSVGHGRHAPGTVQLIAAPDGTNPGIRQNVIGVVGNYGYFVAATASGARNRRNRWHGRWNSSAHWPRTDKRHGPVT